MERERFGSGFRRNLAIEIETRKRVYAVTHSAFTGVLGNVIAYQAGAASER